MALEMLNGEKALASATAYAPATIGNVGPGFDVLGASVEGLADRITVSLITGKSDQVVVTGRNAAEVPLDPQENVAVVAARKVLALCGLGHAIHVSTHRELPLSGGMGGSAAAAVGAAVAAGRALQLFSGIEPTTSQLLLAALEGETRVAGRHLDNIAPCLFGGLCLVRSVEEFDVVQIPLPDKWWVALATPPLKLETKFARSVLSAMSPREVWVNQMAHTTALVHGLHLGDSDLVRRSLVDFYAEPARSPLIPRFNEFRNAAIGAGALGFSISGAGPTMFALCDSKAKADASAAAMSAVERISVHVGRFGGKGALLSNGV